MYEPGTILSGKYEIVEKIGMGGMGAVYRAKEVDFDFGRSVAIKVLPPHLMSDEKLVKRFREEVKILARLEHPNIVAVYNVGQDGDSLYYVMKYLRGETLKTRIRRTGSLSPAQAAYVALQIARALDYIHRAGAIHRDLKSVNVMLDEQDNATVMDFGIAKIAGGANLTRDGEVLGTAPYMAPEQWDGQNDTRSDIYALGILMYEMLVGTPPFSGDSISEIMAAHLRRAPTPLREIRPLIPEPLAEVVHRCLEKDPERRYPTATDLVAVLEDVGRAIHVGGPATDPNLDRTIIRGPQTMAGDVMGRVDRCVREGRPGEAYEMLLAVTPADVTDPSLIERLAQLRELADADRRVVDEVKRHLAGGRLTRAKRLAANHARAYPETHAVSLVRRADKPPAAPVALPTDPTVPIAVPRVDRRRWPYLVGAVALVPVLVFLGTLVFRAPTASLLGSWAGALADAQWYASPPLVNAAAMYRAQLYYDPSDENARRARRDIARHLVMLAEAQVDRREYGEALDYLDQAIGIEADPRWIRLYNRVFTMQQEQP